MAKKQGYDAFVSYNHKNKRFVHEWLVPALKRRRLRVLLDEDVFTGGKYIIAEVENAVRASRAVVLVCTPEYFDSTWTELESKLAFGKVVAVIVKTCKLPDWLQARISLDFKTPAMRGKACRACSRRFAKLGMAVTTWPMPGVGRYSTTRLRGCSAGSLWTVTNTSASAGWA